MIAGTITRTIDVSVLYMDGTEEHFDADNLIGIEDGFYQFVKHLTDIPSEHSYTVTRIPCRNVRRIVEHTVDKR